MSESTELAIDGIATLEGVGSRYLYASPRLGVTSWDCSRTGQRGLSEEKIQLWHVISFVHEGAFELHCQGRRELADSTAATLYNPEDPFRSAHPFGCCDHGSALLIRRDVLLDVMSVYDPAAAETRTAGLFTSSLCRGDLSRVYLRQRWLCHSLAQGEPHDPPALEVAFLEIVGEVVRTACQTKEPKRLLSSRARRQYVLDAQVLLQERFREPLRLEDVAQSLFVSPYHLCRLFKQETGESIHRYLNRLRLREALGQVADGADLGEVAFSLGFSSHSHFTAAFRKEFGVPPSAARALAGHREAAARGGVGR